MIDEILEWLREALDEPGRLLGRLWLAWWVWSFVRRALKGKQAQPPETPAPELMPEPTPAPAPRPAPRPAQRPVPAPSPQRAPQAAGVPRPVAMPAPHPPQSASRSPWSELLMRAEQLRLTLLADRRLRWLEPVLVGEVIEPLRELDRRGGRSEPEHEALASRAVFHLQLLTQVVQERAAEPAATRLAEVDGIARAIQAPVTAYAQAEDLQFAGQHPIAVRFAVDELRLVSGAPQSLLPLRVPRRFGAHLGDYAVVVHELARRWYFGLSTLYQDLPAQLGLPPRMRLPDPYQGYDEQSVQACFGPWLPTLFADTVLTLRLGSGYVAALRQQVTSRAAVATRAEAQGEFLSANPPPILRVHAALTALSALGQHQDVERQRAALAAALPDAQHSYLPLADGRHFVLATEYLTLLTGQLTEELLTVRTTALGGVPLLDWPGLRLTRETAREQRTLLHDLTHGHLPQHADPAQVLCAAWLAWDAGADPAVVLTHLRAALSPRRTATTDAADAAARSATASRPRSLAAAFRDPATIRRAIILGAAFSPPRSSRSQGARGGRLA